MSIGKFFFGYKLGWIFLERRKDYGLVIYIFVRYGLLWMLLREEFMFGYFIW